MAIEDIDGLHQESVRIHFGGGSCDASAHRRRRVELLPPCYGSASRSLLCPYISPFICLFLSVYLLQEEEGAGEGKEREEAMGGITTSQYQVSATGRANPPRRWPGRAGLYQRCQTSGWHKPLALWWDHFSQVLLHSTHSYRDIYCLTGPKLRIFVRLIEKIPQIFLTLHDNHELRKSIVAAVLNEVFDLFLIHVWVVKTCKRCRFLQRAWRGSQRESWFD